MISFIKKLFKNNSQPSLRFVCLIPEIAKQMPIEPAKKANFNWSKKMAASLKQARDEIDKGQMVRHVARCPGISLVSNVGWIQKTYQDIYIKTDGTGGFEWRTPIDQSSLITQHEFKFPYVGHHSPNNTEPFGILKPNTLPTIIKIQSPWIVYVPKGYYLMCMPIPYHDDNRFTSTFGLIDGDAGVNFLNVQLFWHCLNSEEVIPAGTPVAQYFLIKKEITDVQISSFTEPNLEDLRYRRILLESEFFQSYPKLRRDANQS